MNIFGIVGLTIFAFVGTFLGDGHITPETEDVDFTVNYYGESLVTGWYDENSGDSELRAYNVHGRFLDSTTISGEELIDLVAIHDPSGGQPAVAGLTTDRQIHFYEVDSDGELIGTGIETVPPATQDEVRSLAVTKDNTLYVCTALTAGTISGWYRKPASGNWSASPMTIDSSDVDCHDINADPLVNDRVYAIANPGGVVGVFEQGGSNGSSFALVGSRINDNLRVVGAGLHLYVAGTAVADPSRVDFFGLASSGLGGFLRQNVGFNHLSNYVDFVADPRHLVTGTGDTTVHVGVDQSEFYYQIHVLQFGIHYTP